jgi:putative oxidoreductase
MLNPFPDLLTYSLLGPLILRLITGLIFIDLGVFAFKNERARWVASLSALKIPNPQLSVKILGIIEVVGGIMLIIGFYTQIAALILWLITFAESYIEYKSPEILKRDLIFYTMLFCILLSLLLTGAGAFAIDMPL